MSRRYFVEVFTHKTDDPIGHPHGISVDIYGDDGPEITKVGTLWFDTQYEAMETLTSLVEHVQRVLSREPWDGSAG